MMVYELVICIGVSVMGCGSYQKAEFPTKDECIEVLREVRFQKRGEKSTGEDTTDSLAFCRPKKTK